MVVITAKPYRYFSLRFAALRETALGSYEKVTKATKNELNEKNSVHKFLDREISFLV